MYPILLSLGSFHIYSVSLAIVAAWLVFSFLFWRSLRAHGVHEDVIFDLTFYATLVAFVAARAGFILLHWELFAGKSILLMPALWVAPGLSWFGGMVGGLATMVYLSRQRKIRLGHVLDALPFAMGLPIIIGKLGSLLDGAELGRVTGLPWAVQFAGSKGFRHPVQVYEMLVMILVLLVIIRLAKAAHVQKWPYGIVGVWFLGLYSAAMFALEFAKDSRVYWGNITANQWMLIAIFAECIGVLYVRGGGREYMRPFFRSIGTFIRQKAKNIYAKISRRSTQSN